MKKQYSLYFFQAFFAILFLVGCGGSDADSPDGAVRTVLQGVNQNNPVVIWDSLPESYQNDINMLVKEFSSNLDEELYNETMILAGNISGVLKDKKEFFLNSTMLNAVPPEADISKDDISKNWDGVVDSLNILLKSEISNIDSLKKADVGDFFEGTLSEVMEAATASYPLPFDLNDMEVELVSEEGNNAVVRMTPSPEMCEQAQEQNCNPEDKQMVRIEGKWLFKDVADGWKSGIEQARKDIAGMNKEQIAQAKPQIMMMIGMINGVVKQIAAAESQQAFDQSIMGIMALANPEAFK